jgi:hypothetical protein
MHGDKTLILLYLWKHHVDLLLQSFRFIDLRIESFAVINLRGVSTNKSITYLIL